MKHARGIAIAATALIGASALAGCATQADIAADNLSYAAEQFEIPRHIVGINGITDSILFEVTGYCSVETSDSALNGALEYTCKVIDAQGVVGFKKGFLGLGDNVSYVVEQLEPAKVSVGQYNVRINPAQLLPQFNTDARS